MRLLPKRWKTVGSHPEFPFPVVVLAFSRPDALHAQLSALLSQRRALRPEQIYVLQDGVINPWSNEKKISFELSDAVHRAALGHLPAQNVIRFDRNLGISLIWREVLRQAFDTLDAEYALLLEDDFLPGPFYIDAIMRLHELMKAHPRIALANALGYIYSSPPACDGEVVDQHHLWGAFYAREHWRKIVPQLADYFPAIEGVDDRDRAHDRIMDFYRSRGLGEVETSFDAVLAAMLSVNGFARVNTRKAFGELQRLTGVHVTEEVLDNLRVAEPGTLADVASLDITEEAIDAILARQLHHSTRDHVLTPSLLRDLSTPAKVWERQLAGAEAVRWAYRMMLGREPSQGEVRGYEQARHSVGELRSIFLSSAEFQKKHPHRSEPPSAA